MTLIFVFGVAVGLALGGRVWAKWLVGVLTALVALGSLLDRSWLWALFLSLGSAAWICEAKVARRP